MNPDPSTQSHASFDVGSPGLLVTPLPRPLPRPLPVPLPGSLASAEAQPLPLPRLLPRPRPLPRPLPLLVPGSPVFAESQPTLARPLPQPLALVTAGVARSDASTLALFLGGSNQDGICGGASLGFASDWTLSYCLTGGSDNSSSSDYDEDDDELSYL